VNTAIHNKRDLRTAADLDRDEILQILDRSIDLKKRLKNGDRPALLDGCGLAMVFQKPSLRTRSTFDIGMHQLGGHAVYLGPNEIGLGQRESIADIARNLERWFNMIMARTFSQEHINQLAQFSRIPVINALSDFDHPCQALTDVMTLTEKAGKLDGFNLTYLGDGNNVCHSLMVICIRLGINLTISTPRGYEPNASVTKQAMQDAGEHGGSLTFVDDPVEAVGKAQAVYTDVWTSMGQEEETQQRLQDFSGFQLNSKLMASAPEGAMIMHDLPAHRGEEITDDIIDSPNSIVFDQAENRLHVQKGLMVFLHEACPVQGRY
jgi:ornithine carbamoyltransferase